jgi:hypothetical protein
MIEYAHMNEMQQSLRKKLSESHSQDLGRVDSLRSGILALVVAENYDRARDEMVAYIDLKSSFPLFQERSRRYVQHCSELIQAIQTKRNFPGLGTLSMSKQQEIHEKVLEHFEELRSHLKQVERLEREAKLTDVRSTVWVVRMMFIGVVSIFTTALVMDMRHGLFLDLWTVGDQLLDQGINWIFDKI